MAPLPRVRLEEFKGVSCAPVSSLRKLVTAPNFTFLKFQVLIRNWAIFCNWELQFLVHP